MSEVNIYCDESNHLENDKQSHMVLGAIYCPAEKVRLFNIRLREIKEKHYMNGKFEVKWTKVGPKKLPLYLDLIDYFFDNDDLHFRGMVIDKSQLDHKKRNQSHDEWYYKMYFELLSKILDPAEKYCIYLDIKDTNGRKKISKLRDVLSNDLYDFEKTIIKKVQEVRSDEISILQLTDLIIGALQFANRQDVTSSAKKKIVERIKTRSGYDLLKSTLVREPKLNIFYWRGRESII